MDLKDCRFNGKKRLVLSEQPTDSTLDSSAREEYEAKTEANLEEIAELQEKLYADGREGLIIVLQAMDAAGKDSTIKRALSSMNPQGVDVYAFKAPSQEELNHDFLWRVMRCVPSRGKVAVFNRSHYEDIVAVAVRDLWPHFKLPDRCLKEDFISRRAGQIRDFEEYLYQNGVRVLKIFLNVSEKEQKKRFLERLECEDKHWKFSASDLGDRALWDDFQSAYEDAVNMTATKHCPWYVIPADDKWFTRYLVTEALVKTLRKMDPQFPAPDEESEKALREHADKLKAELG